jgi:hypothetical protein
LKDWSQAEVDEILEKYALTLQTTDDPYLTMAELLSHGAPYDYYANEPDDTFDVPGLGVMTAAEFGNFIAGFAAGYLKDPVAYVAVRAGGSLYGALAIPLGDFHWTQIPFGGDDWSSVHRINQGAVFGYARRSRHDASCP